MLIAQNVKGVPARALIDQFLEEHFKSLTKNSDSELKWKIESEKQLNKLLSESNDLTEELKLGSSSRSRNHHFIDDLIRNIISAGIGNQSTELLRAAVHAWINTPSPDFNDWSHSVCHQYEKCSSTEIVARSLLDFPDLSDCVTELVNEAAKRAVEARDTGCLSRLLYGVLAFNLRSATIENLDQPMTYKPESSLCAELIGLFGKENPALKTFLKSDNMRALIEAELDACLDPMYVRPIKFKTELLEALAKQDNSAKLVGYFEKIYASDTTKVAAKDILSNIRSAREAKETITGLFVDVDGVLIEKGRDNQGNNTNQLSQIAKSIELLTPIGAKVVIFSGANPEHCTEQLRKLGFSERFLPVQSKSNYHGKKLEYLIDDTQPDRQGFSVEKFIAVDEQYYWQASVSRLVELDPFGVVADYNARKNQSTITPINLENESISRNEGFPQIRPEESTRAAKNGFFDKLRNLFS